MADTGTIETHEPPIAVTGELPLDDENVLAPPPPTYWRRNRWPLAGVAIVVVAAAIALPLWLSSGSSTPTGLSVTTVTVSVTTGTIRQTVASSGTVAPASQANLNFAVSGTVTAVDVKAGQTVTAGQVVATLDTTALTDQVNAAEEQLTAANDRLASDQASGASTSTIDSDKAAVTSAQSSLSTARTNLNDASLTSSISGTVAQVNLTVGQQVSTGSSGSSSGQIEVIGTNSYIISATVDDTQIGQISDGDQVNITPTGASTPVYGTVGSISLIGSQSSNVTTFPVTIDVTGSPSGLYPGASASLSIIVKQLNNVTEVPTAAISYDSSGQATVTEVVNGAHVVKDVTTGASENGETQIVSGVSPGAKILEQQIRFNAPGGGTGLLGGGNGGKGLPGGGSGSFFQHSDTGGGPGGGSFPVTSGS
jgi:RND family efflux transporter MFP subunit